LIYIILALLIASLLGNVILYTRRILYRKLMSDAWYLVMTINMLVEHDEYDVEKVRREMEIVKPTIERLKSYLFRR